MLSEKGLLIDTTASKAYTRRSAFELKNEGSGKLGAKFQPHRAAAHMGRAHPIGAEKEVKINEEIALKWLHQGAIPSDTVRSLFKEAGIMKKFAEAKDKKEV